MATTINFDHEAVNMEEANYVLDQLNHYQTLFRERAIYASYAFTKAFSEDPKRFNHAKNAKTFDEYIQICNGQ
jgi:hypothetical protein